MVFHGSLSIDLVNCSYWKTQNYTWITVGTLLQPGTRSCRNFMRSLIFSRRTWRDPKAYNVTWSVLSIFQLWRTRFREMGTETTTKRMQRGGLQLLITRSLERQGANEDESKGCSMLKKLTKRERFFYNCLAARERRDGCCNVSIGEIVIIIITLSARLWLSVAWPLRARTWI